MIPLADWVHGGAALERDPAYADRTAGRHAHFQVAGLVTEDYGTILLLTRDAANFRERNDECPGFFLTDSSTDRRMAHIRSQFVLQ